jgi:hypothetical protein
VTNKTINLFSIDRFESSFFIKIKKQISKINFKRLTGRIPGLSQPPLKELLPNGKVNEEDDEAALLKTILQN